MIKEKSQILSIICLFVKKPFDLVKIRCIIIEIYRRIGGVDALWMVGDFIKLQEV